MIKIRLMRIGAKKRPFYRVVVIDERTKRNGVYLEALGTYNPLTEPKEIILKQDRIDYWVKLGAQASDGFLRITGKMPQKPPRKPKKASHQAGEQKKVENQSISEPTLAESESTSTEPESTDQPETTEAQTETDTPTSEEATEEAKA